MPSIGSFDETTEQPEQSASRGFRKPIGGKSVPSKEPGPRQPGTRSRKLRVQQGLREAWRLLQPFRWLFAGSLMLIIVSRLCGFAVPVASRYLINEVMYKQNFEALPLIVGSVVIAMCIQGLCVLVLHQSLGFTGQRVIADLRMKAQQHVARLPVAFYDGNRAGSLAARIMNDVEGVGNLLGTGFADLMGGILASIIALVILIRISPLMTFLALSILLNFGWFLKVTFGITRPLFRERSKIAAEVTGRLTESLSGVREIKAYRAEAEEAKVFASGVNRLLNSLIRSIKLQSYLSLSSTIMIGLIGGLIMYLGAREVKLHRLDVGSYVEFNLLLAYMVAPAALLVSVGTQLTEAFAGLDRTSELLKEAVEDPAPGRIQVLHSMRGDIVFSHVNFSYVPGTQVLYDIDFHAKAGSVTALVGASGSGKSTVISLVCGFHQATSGRVIIDGVDLNAIHLSSYRKELGVVLQDAFLFEGTIRENVLFSRPRATEQQWMEACRIAQVDEFATRLPEQYETIIGERGIRLSGGQRQRMSIARAILADPRILILDEATSSLDSESEALIQSGLSFLMQGRTILVIAHRLSTIRRADQILVMEKGRIVEHGTHATLYRMKGRYYDLYTRQYGLERNLFLAPGEGDKVIEQ
jgi:ABC-type multidrug transport system fused ATPase/permease subunit